MSTQERIATMTNSDSFWVWLLGAILAAAWWVVRTVLTNKHRVDAIEKKTDEIHKDVREIRAVLLQGKSE